MAHVILKTDSAPDPILDALLKRGHKRIEDPREELESEDPNIIILGVVTKRNYPSLIDQITKLDGCNGSIFFPNQTMPPHVSKEFATCTGRNVIFNQANTRCNCKTDSEKFTFSAVNTEGQPAPFLCALPYEDDIQEMSTTTHEIYNDSGFGQFVDIEREQPRNWGSMTMPMPMPMMSSAIQTPMPLPKPTPRRLTIEYQEKGKGI